MPFNPRIVPTEPAPLDGQGELQLPDDLAALAEQLSADSRHLANCFPAGAVGIATEPAVRTRPRTWRVRHMIGGGLIACALSGALVMLTTNPFAQPRRTLPAAAPASTGNRTSAAVTVRAANSATRDVSFAPTMLNDVSRPELEGLIDLWQQQSTEAASVSF